MKVDLAGPKRRGLALGINEFAGYVAVGFTAWITGYIAGEYALRPQPFHLGIAVAIVGLLLSAFGVRETINHARLEAELQDSAVSPAGGVSQIKEVSKLSLREIFWMTSWKDRNLFSCSQAGLVNNLNDGMAWGIYPLFFASYGLGVAAIGTIKAIYPATWGVFQLFTGHLSDRWWRK